MRFQIKRRGVGSLACKPADERADGVAQQLVARGAIAVQFLVLLVPVLFAMIGFALDLGILYSTKGELKTAADAMALAAANRLNGTTS